MLTLLFCLQQYLQKGGQDASKGATDSIRCYG